MKQIQLGHSGLRVPTVAVGCMRLKGLDKREAEALIRTAMDMGANFFDHADIYGGGACESHFADAVGMNPALREQMIIQSKCGIISGKRYDLSAKHILEAVDGSLKRLRTDYLDVLLLHRPDALVEPEQVAEAFDKLEQSGKVRHFGVSNHSPYQIELLKKCVKQPLVVNQLQFSIMHAGMVSTGMNVNIHSDFAIDRDGGVLDYCRLHDITIQPWSPFQYGMFEGVFLNNPKFPQVNAKIDEIAEKHGVSNTAIAVAWILRHPAHMQPIIGTTNVGRLQDCIRAAELELTGDEWYEILMAAGYPLP